MKKFIIFLSLLFISIDVNALKINEKEIKVTLNDCVDGDTAKFNYNDEIIKVRFLAIDTPESVHPTKKEEPYGKQASNFTCNKLKEAKHITIKFDSNSDIKDKYDRYLGWIFVDNKLLQQEIISNGYAKVAYLYGDYKYTDILKQEEKIAKNNKLGIWSDEKEISVFKIIIVILVIIILCIISPKFKKKTTKKIKKLIKTKKI